MLCNKFDKTLDKENFIGHHIGKTVRHFHHFFVDELKAYDFSFEEGVLLLIISEEPHINSNHIAKELKKNKATISRGIKVLITKGLITQQTDKDDGRMKFYALTENGEKVLNIIKRKIQKLENLFHTKCSQQDINTCIRVLSCMQEAIVEYSNTHKQSFHQNDLES